MSIQIPQIIDFICETLIHHFMTRQIMIDQRNFHKIIKSSKLLIIELELRFNGINFIFGDKRHTGIRVAFFFHLGAELV